MCATRAPASAQDCNPELDPGGSFCCLTTTAESDAEADAEDGSTDASVGCGATTMGGPGPDVNEADVGQVVATAYLASGSSTPNQYGFSMEYPSYVPVGNSSPDGAAPPMCSCQSQMGVGDPAPNLFPGPVLLESATGATLAMLLPRSGSASGMIHGWNPGQTLEVCAKDSPMDSFSGSLRTAALPSGISPPIGATPNVVHASQGLTVSWISDNGGDDQVTVALGQQVAPDFSVSCTCTAPDSAGSVTFDSTLLSQFDAEASVGPSIWLSRSTTSIVHSDEANIVLVGEVGVAGTVTFQ
jgi:hypothetical protein